MVTNNSGNAYIVPTTDNEVTMPSQPSFLAYLATTDTSVTGDDTIFYLGDTDVGTALTEIFDQNSDFTTGASGGAIFTAPVTGRYYLQVAILFRDIDSAGATQLAAILKTSNRYYGNYYGVANVTASDSIAIMYSTFADLDAADTLTYFLNASGGTKTVDIDGSAQNRSWVSGCLVV